MRHPALPALGMPVFGSRLRAAFVFTISIMLFPRPACPCEVTAGRLGLQAVARLHDLVAESASEDGPGLALVVVDREGIAFEEYRGLANMEWNTRIGPHSRFYLGSLSKQFTAAALLTLVQDGLVDLDAPVRDLVPELPECAEAIMVRDLLHHTSGLRDYLKIRQMAGSPDEEPFDNGDVLEILARQRRLVFEPSSTYQYSNSNYVLLAEIIARIAGEDFADYVDRRIFDPAALDETMFEVDPGLVVPLRVESYKTRPGQPYRRFLKVFSAVGDGGAWSTAHDLAHWAGILLRRDTLDRAFLDQLLQPDERKAEATYACGLHVRHHRGVPVIEHGGSMLGFEHWFMLFPEQGIGFVLLTNDKSIDTIAIRGRLAGILVGDALGSSDVPPTVQAPPGPSRIATPVLPPLPKEVFGRYHNDEIPVDLTLGRGAGGLVVTPSTFRPMPARRTEASRLEAMGGSLTIEVAGDQEQPMLRVTLDELGTFEFRRVPDSAGDGSAG
jgi:CubicO group peptidase (beta-lactamase class C family)